MLRTHQRWVLDDHVLEQSALRHDGLIVAHTKSRGLPIMELGGGTAPEHPRGWAWLVLQGEVKLQLNGRQRCLRAGEVLVATEHNARFVGTSPDASVLQVLFRGPSKDNEGQLSRVQRRHWASLLPQQGPLRPSALPECAALLGQPGLSEEIVSDCLRSTLDPEDVRLAALIGRLSCELSRHPGMDDIAAALKKPERRASEVAASYFRRYHASFSGWRAYLNTLRLELAWNLLSQPDLSASRLSAWLGYRSSTSMYHALQRQGLRTREKSNAARRRSSATSRLCGV